mgnify:CR=1 FL=1
MLEHDEANAAKAIMMIQSVLVKSNGFFIILLGVRRIGIHPQIKRLPLTSIHPDPLQNGQFEFPADISC